MRWRRHRGKKKYRSNKAVYRERNNAERLFVKVKQFRYIAARYDKRGANFFAFSQPRLIGIFLRSASTACVRVIVVANRVPRCSLP